MADGFVLPPGGGEQVGPGRMGITIKVGTRDGAAVSMFETVIGPGFDVGAHVHRGAEELFFVLEGELDLLAFEPRVRTSGDWQDWESAGGRKVVRGGPGAFMYVPRGCPHAFSNPGPGVARVLFQVTPAGHERYFHQLADYMRSGRLHALAELRSRHDIEQLTAPGRRPAFDGLIGRAAGIQEGHP